jgi:hypothetical protein
MDLAAVTLGLPTLEGATMNEGASLRSGALLMLIASLAFVGYAVVFLIRNFSGGGFELGVETLNGVSREDLNDLNPAIMHYIGHLHVATAGFIAATGIAVAALSWYGVRRGDWWAFAAAVVSPVVGLAVALPYHYAGAFEHDWIVHLGPIYAATILFVAGALLAFRALTGPGRAVAGSAPQPGFRRAHRTDGEDVS